MAEVLQRVEYIAERLCAGQPDDYMTVHVPVAKQVQDGTENNYIVKYKPPVT
jgi:hypothetical protein